MPTPTTRWSLIVAARGQSSSARSALAQLCENYRPVVLDYFRRHDNPQFAEDRTQAFFLHFLQRQLQDRADAARGSFRAFLYTAVRNHWHQVLRHEATGKRDTGVQVGEEALDRVSAGDASPEQQFDRDWAMNVLRRSRELLRAEALLSGKSELFEAVERFLLEAADDGEYVNIGARLGVRPNSVAVAVRRLRERLRAVVRRELADTLPPGADAELELEWLKQALRGD